MMRTNCRVPSSAPITMLCPISASALERTCWCGPAVLAAWAAPAGRNPADYPNEGWVFKHPPRQFAASLVQTAGLKGMRIGGAGFSSRHANFIINLGGARADDVRRLLELAREKVQRATGI